MDVWVNRVLKIRWKGQLQVRSKKQQKSCSCWKTMKALHVSHMKMRYPFRCRNVPRIKKLSMPTSCSTVFKNVSLIQKEKYRISFQNSPVFSSEKIEGEKNLGGKNLGKMPRAQGFTSLLMVGFPLLLGLLYWRAVSCWLKADWTSRTLLTSAEGSAASRTEIYL